MNSVLIIAGGKGERMHNQVPKQFISVFGKPIILYTISAFQNHNDIDDIYIVCIEGWQSFLKTECLKYGITKLRMIISGGKTGFESIRKGLFSIEESHSQDDIVLIHDAIRPLVSADIISDCIEKAKQYGSAISSIPCQEAMLETHDGLVSSGSFPRENLKRAQTPQGFRLLDICNAHRYAIERGITNSVASCTLMEELGFHVCFSLGSEKNIKLTTPEDLEIFKALLNVQKRIVK